jgi:alpha-ketoglutarate-dependent taurine dioxygenase
MDQSVLKPFGVQIQAETPETRIDTILIDVLQELILKHRVCVLRGYHEPMEDEILSFCRKLGHCRHRLHSAAID